MTTTKFNFITFWIWKVNKFHHSQHQYWAKATLFHSSLNTVAYTPKLVVG
jgi:hypothetical protein